MEDTMASNSTLEAPEKNQLEPATQEPEETPQQIVDKIMGLKKSYEQATVDSRKEIGEIYNSYLGKMENVVNAPYDTKETIPKLRTEIAYIKPFIFSGEPELEFEGVGDEDKTISKIYEKMVNYRFRTIPDFREKIEAWVAQAIAFPASELKVVWRFQTKQNPDGTETPVQDEPDIEVPNHLDVYFNPIIQTVADQEAMIFRSVLPLSKVKVDPIYTAQDLDGVRNAEKLEDKNVQSDVYNSSQLMNSDIPNAQEKATAGMTEVFELMSDDRTQTIANGKLLRDVENPYGFKTVIKLIFEPNVIPNRYEGFGVGNNTLGLDKMFYKMFNQAMMNIKLGNNPMFMYKKGSVADKSQFVGKPAGGIEVKSDGPIRENIEFIQFPDLSNGFTAILSKVDDETKRASGATDLVQGSSSNDTLGQDEIVQSNVSNRFELIVRRFKASLAQLGKMILKMELHNLQSPEADILRIFSDEIPSGQKDPITGKDIMVPGMRKQIYEVLVSSKEDVKYNVKVKGETNIARNKSIEGKRLVELFNLTQNFLTDKEKRAFARKIAETQGEDNIDEIIGEENPIMQQQEQMQLQQGQMQEQQMAMGVPGQPKQGMVGGQQPQGMNSGVQDNL